MKEFIKKILGDEIIFRAREVKNKFFPGEAFRLEKELMKRVQDFYSGFVKKGDLCFDVGANLGNKVQPLLDLGAKVIAVEPQESCRAILQLKFRDRITIVPKGLGEKEEVKEFYISDSSTISSFSKEWINEVKKSRFKEHNWNTIKQIEITTLDNLIRIYGSPVFIKIDVEGYELEVLKGLSKPVPMISFEYTVPEQTGKTIACINQLRSIDPNIECNYSYSDSMELSLNKWESADEIIATINSKEFINTGFGDLYVRSKIKN